MPLWAAIALALCAAGCRCEAPLVQLQPARVVVSPHELVLPVAWVGQQTSGVVELSNQGEATAELEVTVVGASFASSPTTLRLARGQSAEVRVTFAPGSAGAHEGGCCSESSRSLFGLKRSTFPSAARALAKKRTSTSHRPRWSTTRLGGSSRVSTACPSGCTRRELLSVLKRLDE